ncbi:unnamed protein product [Closterium sp. NIES-65]|nr:unnamed protein product [Closterium sp. NIES-65]
MRGHDSELFTPLIATPLFLSLHTHSLPCPTPPFPSLLLSTRPILSLAVPSSYCLSRDHALPLTPPPPTAHACIPFREHGRMQFRPRMHPLLLTHASPSPHASIPFPSRIHPPPGGEQVEGGEGRGGGEGEQTRQHRLPGPCFCNRAPGGEQMEGGEGLGGGEGEQTRQRRLPG